MSLSEADAVNAAIIADVAAVVTRREPLRNYTSGRRLIRANGSIVWKGQQWVPRQGFIAPNPGQRVHFHEERYSTYNPYQRHTRLRASNACQYMLFDPTTAISEGL